MKPRVKVSAAEKESDGRRRAMFFRWEKGSSGDLIDAMPVSKGRFTNFTHGD